MQLSFLIKALAVCSCVIRAYPTNSTDTGKEACHDKGECHTQRRARTASLPSLLNRSVSCFSLTSMGDEAMTTESVEAVAKKK